LEKDTIKVDLELNNISKALIFNHAK